MLISEDASLSQYVIKSYSRDQIKINEYYYAQSLIVTPTELMTHWRPRDFSELKKEDFHVLIELKPEFVLLGTGSSFKQLPKDLNDYFKEILTIETMTTAAACRSFTALSSEGRYVAAALIL